MYFVQITNYYVLRRVDCVPSACLEYDWRLSLPRRPRELTSSRNGWIVYSTYVVLRT